jgi:uncharacterized protein YceK
MNMKLAIAALILFVVSGCASYYTRISNASGSNDGQLYPAARADVFAVGALCTFEELHGMWVLVPLPVVDLVPSLVTDTLLLPYDGFILWRLNRK